MGSTPTCARPRTTSTPTSGRGRTSSRSGYTATSSWTCPTAPGSTTYGVRCELSPDHARATLHVEIETGGAPASLAWRFADPSGVELVGNTAGSPDGGITIELDRPRLWWPWPHGAPELYSLEIDLRVGEEVGHPLHRYPVRASEKAWASVDLEPEARRPGVRIEDNGADLANSDALPAAVHHCKRAARQPASK